MHCEEARQRLFDRLDRVDPALDGELDAHLQSCAECRAVHQGIGDMQARARVWHDVPPPAWKADAPALTAAAPAFVGRPGWLPWVQQWFPVLASTAALVLAVSLYWQDAPSTGSRAGSPPASGGGLDGSPGGEPLLTVSRRERQQELEALTALLKAEMDRRALETEESLKYIISHQIQSQRQLDALRGRLEQASATPPEQL